MCSIIVTNFNKTLLLLSRGKTRQVTHKYIKHNKMYSNDIYKHGHTQNSASGESVTET